MDLSVDDNELKLEGFTSFRHDISSRAEGVIPYVNSNLHPMPVTQLNNGYNIQAVWVKLNSVYGKDDHLLLCSMYRPPNSSVEYFNNIVENIEIASAYGHDYIIFGDLNIDVTEVKRTPSNGIVKLENYCGLTQLIQYSTRIITNSSTLIDVVLTSAPQFHSVSGVLKCKMSDHYAVFTVIDKNSRNKAKPHLVTTRDYKRFHLKNFLNDLSLSLSSTLTTRSTYHSVHTAWDKWKSVFLECSNHYAPLKTFRVSQVTSAFKTPDIRQLIYHRDYLHSKAVKYSDELLWSEYRKIRNLITSQISKAKKQYFASRVLQSSGNMGPMWNTLKGALNKNNRDNSSTDLSPDDFNDYFSTINC